MYMQVDEKKIGKQSNWMKKEKKKKEKKKKSHLRGINQVHMGIFSPQFSPHFEEKTFW